MSIYAAKVFIVLVTGFQLEQVRRVGAGLVLTHHVVVV